jgi:hypothetical protein
VTDGMLLARAVRDSGSQVNHSKRNGTMYKRFAAVLALTSVVTLGACSKTEEGDEATTADTTTVQGTDVVDVPTTVPTTDTVVQTTTTETDTIHGDVDADTMRRDSTPQ